MATPDIGYNSLLAQILGLEGIVRVQNPALKKTDGRSAKWYIRAWVDVIKDGNLVRDQQRIYIGNCDAMGKREALTEKTRLLSMINKSQYVAQSQIPFGEFLALYEKNHITTLKASTQAKYETHIKNHIRPHFEALRMGEITTLAVQQWINAKKATKLSPYTLADLKNLMSSIFSKAEDWGHWRDRNPIDAVTIPKIVHVRERKKLTSEQTLKLLCDLQYEVRLIVETALFCTLRISEVMGLQWKHIDLANGVLSVRQRYWRGDVDTPKTQESTRDVPMGYLAQELMAKWPGSELIDDYVFSVPTHKGTRHTRDDRSILRYFVRPVAKKLGVYYKGFGFHSFRREAITSLAQSGGPMMAMKMAGHSKMDQTMGYVLKDDVAQTRAVEEHQKRYGKEKVN